VASANAQAAPDQPPQLPPAFGGNDSRMMAWLHSAGHPGGILDNLANGITALQTGQRSDAVGIQQQNMRAEFQATRDVLLQSGMAPQEANSKAMLAVLNKDAGKTILPEALTSKEEYKTEKDALGQEHGYWINTRNQTKTAAQTEGGGSGGGTGYGIYAPGVSQIDSSKIGQDYLNQFGPEVKAAVAAYRHGDVMPTGNPRLQGISTLAKTVAQKVGMDEGEPVSDATYAAKRNMKMDLTKSGNSSMGGILSNGQSSFAHLGELGESMAGLGNASHNFPGGGHVATVQNYLGNAVAPSSTTIGKTKRAHECHAGDGSQDCIQRGNGGLPAKRKELDAGPP
jgi:hypothetical protein